ncbi:hypothetical protein IKF12_00445 [Candidatus Saccharibacteria bacterium]|nr:hypothetical protein [Candidatus Saccharibacteria bacterium]
MNRRYIDFVPNSNPEPTQVMPSRRDFRAETAETATSARAKAKVSTGAKQKTSTKAIDDVKVAKSKRVSAKPSAVMGRGMIETANEKPLKSNKKAPAKTTATNAKEKEIIMQQAARKADDLNKTYKTPHFVNTEKVAKRPLSKNVYQKKIVEPKEEPQAPVTIIHKPEKDSKMGLIVTIILTIILGAAAGTVAFLLLPK